MSKDRPGRHNFQELKHGTCDHLRSAKIRALIQLSSPFILEICVSKLVKDSLKSGGVLRVIFGILCVIIFIEMFIPLFSVFLETNTWYHQTFIEGDNLSISIGSEYD
jgi:hypothetical protein